MKNLFISALVFSAACVFSGCMKWDYDFEEEPTLLPEHGLFILNEGNFQYGNATLSFYDPTTDSVSNEIFYRANGMKLGDVAQSMTIYDNTGWIVVNNSHVVFAIDLATAKEKGRIVNLTSPRYIHFISPTKAYISQLWDNRITIVNPRTFSITGYIEVPGMTMETGSTEQMVTCGDYVYCNCWSYQNRIIRIDPTTDRVVDELTVGRQPASIVLDRNDNLWTITDGGYDNSPAGQETPALSCIDTRTFTVKSVFLFNDSDTPSEIKINSQGNRLYWINKDVWCMDIDADALPQKPLVKADKTLFYGLTVSPASDDVYVADAVDYQQKGMIYRYSPSGELKDKFYAGITPGAFCWK